MTSIPSNDEIASLLVGEERDWLNALPPYQRDVLEQLRSAGVPFEELGRTWIEASGAANTAPFGVTAGARMFYDRFLDELHDLLCSEDKYAAERDGILQGFKGGQATAVAAVTAAIAEPLAAAPPFLAPAVAVTVCLVGKAGLGAWCDLQEERRSARRQLELDE